VKPLGITKRDTGKAVSIGAPLTEGVIAHSFAWSGDGSGGYFSLSLVNKLHDPVGNVNCVVTFYNKEGLPLSSVKVSVDYSGEIKRIEPGAAVRVSGQVDPEVVRLAGFAAPARFRQGMKLIQDPDGLIHEFPETYTAAQVTAAMEEYWKRRESMTKIRVLGFELLH
jgi:hypothetical protein